MMLCRRIDFLLFTAAQNNFNEKLFRVLAEHDINENSFLGHTITQLVIDELEAFYNILAEESGI